MSARMLRATARGLLGLAAVLVATTIVIAPASAADGLDGDTEFNVSVKVLKTTASPTPSVSPSRSTSATTGSGSGSGSGSATTPSAVNTAAGDQIVGDDDVTIVGGLYISGIEGATSPSVNPFDGRADFWFTVRNYSNETVDAAAEFSLATVFGGRIDGERVTIKQLKAGEVRVVSSTLSGSGQWPLVVGRVTFDPPAVIDGQQTADVSRAVLVPVFPWLLVIAAVLVAIAIVLLQLGRSFAATPAAPTPLAGTA